MKLETLHLAPTVQQHMEDHGADPVAFVGDETGLARIRTLTDDTLGDALLECYQYTTRLESRRETDNFRWCFSMLMISDLIESIRPGGSGRVGEVMLPQVLERINVPVDDARRKLGEWSRCGSKLNMFCNEFGHGCLFYLKDILSKDLSVRPSPSSRRSADVACSLLNKCTFTGDYHNDGFAHLKTLGLREKAVESGANTLGLAIRALLCRPFRDAATSVVLSEPTAP